LPEAIPPVIPIARRLIVGIEGKDGATSADAAGLRRCLTPDARAAGLAIDGMFQLPGSGSVSMERYVPRTLEYDPNVPDGVAAPA
jgi:hypothetical protein